MKRKLLGIGIMLLLLLPFTLAGTRYERTASLVMVGVGWLVLLSFSVYKLALLSRHRRDPAKRERLLSTSWVLPPKLNKFVAGDKDDVKMIDLGG